MAKVERHGVHPVSERALFSLELATVGEWPDDLGLPTRHFVLFIAGDARKASEALLRKIARKALSQGMAYLVAWGPDCERVHDVFEEEVEEADPDSTPESMVLTEWLDEDPLPEALWFAAHTAGPSSDFEGSCGAMLAVTIASPKWAKEIRRLLARPGSLGEEE